MCGPDGEDPDGLFSFAEVYAAYRECRKNKRGTINALKFEADLVENLQRLGAELRDSSYRPSRAICFVVHKPKLREIFAADFRDRVVHQVLVRRLLPYFESAFIHDTYACRKGKGTLAAVARLRAYLRQVTRNGKQPAYYLQLDVKSFFMQIDRPALFAIVERRLRKCNGLPVTWQPALPGFDHGGASEGETDRSRGSESVGTLDALLWLARTIIHHDPTSNYLFRGDRRVLNRVPRHKSLFGVEPGRGLPIGNLTSQFFASVYLDRLDQFVKHTLKVRRYVRYVDDFVIVERGSERFDEYIERIDGFLRDKLKLELKPEAVRRGRVSDGIDFLGYIQRPSHTLVRRRVVNSFKRKLLEFEQRLVQASAQRTVCRCDHEILERLLAVVNGYLAHFGYADARRLCASIPDNNRFLNVYFRFHDNRALRRYSVGRAFASFAAQVKGLGGPREAAGELVVVRAGEFYELYGKSGAWAAEHLGLKLLGPRRGMHLRAGFHRDAHDRYLDRTLAAGKTVAVIEEEDVRIGGLKVRRLDQVVVPRNQEHIRDRSNEGGRT